MVWIITSTVALRSMETIRVTSHPDCKNPVHRQRSKHIDVKCHLICDAQREGKIVIVYCPSEDMVAHISTKPVTKITMVIFKRFFFGC